MKFERQRGGQAVPDKYELSNQEFLTFRNSPVTENSGRTVYSQQFDYRSLDRYDKPDQQPEPNFNFRKNVKNMRSTDKYRQLKEEALLFQMTEENSEAQAGSVERREELRGRLAKLKKSVKRELKREGLLQEQVSLVEGEVEELQEGTARQRNDVEELRLILRDNEKNIERMTRKLEESVGRGREMEERMHSIAGALESAAKTNRSNEHSSLEVQKYPFPHAGS